MKQVDVYEVSKTVRTLEGSYDQIPMTELHGLSGRAWGNPGGGDTFIRYSAPVTHVRDSWVEDGFTHKRDYYVAIAPQLLRLLAPAIDETLSAQLHANDHELANLGAKVARGQEAWKDLAYKQQVLAVDLEDARHNVRNFLEANVLTRIWRAIRQRLV